MFEETVGGFFIWIFAWLFIATLFMGLTGWPLWLSSIIGLITSLLVFGFLKGAINLNINR